MSKQSQLTRHPRRGRTPRASAHAQRGFSLVELMLALALGLVVVTGIVQLFVGNSQTYTILNGQSRLQENARFVFEFMSRAARTAGYFGCAPETDFVVKGLRGAWNSMPEFNMQAAVSGYQGNDDGTWTPALSGLPRTVGGANANVHTNGNGIDISTIIEGTDVVVFRAMAEPSVRLTQVLQPDEDPVVEAPGNNAPFANGDIVIVADCEQAAVFRVTGVTTAANESTLAHATAAGGSPYENSDTVEGPGGAGTVPATLSVLGRSYGEETTVGEFVSTFFWIAPSAVDNAQGNPVNALWQKVGTDAPVELVQGVNDLEILYGVDTTLNDGIANANQYMDFDDVPDPAQIVSLRVTTEVNSVDAVTDDGNQLTRTFSKTLLVRNANPGA